ncbi:MAG: carbohydrate ABC transporter permease [Clostridia bacterium]|nr:carbohydrate ABC transporter permease [Clostridia bacterium]
MNRKYVRMLRDGLQGCLGVLLGCLVLFPVFYGAAGAFKTPSEMIAYPPGLMPASFAFTDNFRAVFTQAPMLRYFLNSLVTALLTAVVRLGMAVLAAYAFAFFSFRGERILFFLLMGTMMLPADTLVITNYQTVSRLGLTDTYLGICIVSFVGASQMFMLRQHFKASPISAREAAMMDGCGEMRFLLSVLLPMSLPVISVLFVQCFIAQWNAYLWPLMITNTDLMRTVQVGITMLTTPEGTNYGTILAGAAVVMVPSVILFAVLHRSMTGGNEK